MEDIVVANGNQYVMINILCSTDSYCIDSYCIDNMYWGCFITLTHLCCTLLLSHV